MCVSVDVCVWMCVDVCGVWMCVECGCVWSVDVSSGRGVLHMHIMTTFWAFVLSGAHEPP